MSDNIKSTSLEEKMENQFQETQKASQVQADQKISIDAQTFFMVKLQEFDKMIAEAESNVANLKMQKASYIYDTNVQQILQSKQQSQSSQETKPE